MEPSCFGMNLRSNSSIATLCFRPSLHLSSVSSPSSSFSLFAHLPPYPTPYSEFRVSQMEKTMKEDTESLTLSCSDYESDSLLDEFAIRDLRQRWTARRIVVTTFISLISIAIYTALVVFITTKRFDSECYGGPTFIPNVAQDAIRFQPQYFQDYHKPDHPFFGMPTKALDRNWMELMKCESFMCRVFNKEHC